MFTIFEDELQIFFNITDRGVREEEALGVCWIQGCAQVLTVRDRHQDWNSRFSDRDRGVCQSVWDETAALMGLKTALRLRRPDQDHIPDWIKLLSAVRSVTLNLANFSEVAK